MNVHDRKPIGPEGRLILETDARLTNRLRMLMSSGRFRRKRLISGFMGKALLNGKKAQKTSPERIWRAFPEASFCRKRIFERRFKLPGGDFFDQFGDYLLEHFDGDQARVSQVFEALDRWNQLVADLPTPEVRNEIQKLCGWIEADAAFIAFANYKRHRPTMARNPLKAFGASVGL